MRVCGSANKKRVRPYGISIFITIGSFLLAAILTQACPEYFSESISPPSRFSSPARVIDTDTGACVIQDKENSTEEYKRESRFAYINFCIGKALYNNSNIAELREWLKQYRAWQLHIEKIPKEAGFYLTYRKSPRDQPHIIHYCLKEKDLHKDRYNTLIQADGGCFFVESLNKELYNNIKNRVKVFFSPEGRCEEEVIAAIDGAEKAIDAAVYNITNRKIADALKRAKRRGAVVRLFLNGKRDANEIGKELESCGIKVKYYYKKKNPEHDRFMMVDEENVLGGSYDWTDVIEKEGRENLIALPYLIDFREEFNNLWERKEWPVHNLRSPMSYISVLFSTNSACEARIRYLIHKVSLEKQAHPETRKAIKIALFLINNRDIARELFDAKQAGVDVEIILDKTQKKQSRRIEKYFKTLQKRYPAVLSPRGRLVMRYYRIENGMMHNKFAIIGDMTITGSYSWVKEADSKNNRSLIMISQPAEDYPVEFGNIWNDFAEEVIIDQGGSDKSQPYGEPFRLSANAGSGAPPGPPPKDENKIFYEYGHSTHGHGSHSRHKNDEESDIEEDDVIQNSEPYEEVDSWYGGSYILAVINSIGLKAYLRRATKDFVPQGTRTAVIKKGTVFFYRKMDGGKTKRIIVLFNAASFKI